jgi:hypothetical protein
MRAKAYALSLLGSYRTTDVDDPAVYVANAVAVLTRYGEGVVAQVCGPGIGIQTRQKWLPTVSELREACDQIVGEQAARERRALLAEHRVLIDTPYGPKPEAEGLALLASPEAQRRMSDDERTALAERVSREIRAAAEAQRKEDAPPPEDIPPPELVDPDAQLLWYEERLKVLQPRIAAEGLPQMSNMLKASLGLPIKAKDAA